MLENHKSNIGVFVDESNVYHIQKTLGWKIDYKLLKEYLGQFGNISVVNLYLSYKKMTSGQKKFIDKLENYGYKVSIKKIKKIKNGNEFVYKGNLDVELSSDILLQKGLFEQIFLVSGDSDFEYVLKLLKNENKKITIISTGGHVSWELIKIADEYIDLKKIEDQIKHNQQALQINLEGF